MGNLFNNCNYYWNNYWIRIYVERKYYLVKNLGPIFIHWSSCIKSLQEYGKLIHDPGSLFAQKPRSLFGIHEQKQANKYYAGIHIPVGRLSAEGLQDLAAFSLDYLMEIQT